MRERRRRDQRLRQRGRGPDGRWRSRRSTTATAATRSSTSCASASSPQEPARARPRRRARATSPCCSARRPGATASAGASVLASAGFAEGLRAASDPSVQVGDPFEEKRLIEACLELLDAGLAVGIQDLGAGGLSCAASETAAKSGLGMDVDVAAGRASGAAHDPGRGHDVREPGADAGDRRARPPRRACSRSAPGGRCAPGRRARSPTAGGSASSTARSTTTPSAGARRRARSASLGDGPVYTRPVARPASQDDAGRGRPLARRWPAAFPDGADLGPELARAARRPHARRQVLGVAPVRPPALPQHGRRARRATPACCACRGHRRAAWRSRTDGSAAFCRLDPRAGGRLAVLEAARNVACVGADPAPWSTASTSATPSTPTVMWQFAAGRRRDPGRVRCARRARDRRQRQLLQRVPRARHRPDARHRRRRPARPRSSGSRRRRRCGPGQASCCSARPRPSSVGRRGPREPRPDRRAPTGGRPRQRRRRPRVRPRASSPTTRCSGVHDCADGGVAAALAEMAIVGECGVGVARRARAARRRVVLRRVRVAGGRRRRPGGGPRRARGGRATPRVPGGRARRHRRRAGRDRRRVRCRPRRRGARLARGAARRARRTPLD